MINFSGFGGEKRSGRAFRDPVDSNSGYFPSFSSRANVPRFGYSCPFRAKEIQPSVGIIMISSLTDDQIARRTFELGAYDYVTKPIALDRLEELIAVKLLDLTG